VVQVEVETQMAMQGKIGSLPALLIGQKQHLQHIVPLAVMWIVKGWPLTRSDLNLHALDRLLSPDLS